MRTQYLYRSRRRIRLDCRLQQLPRTIERRLEPQRIAT